MMRARACVAALLLPASVASLSPPGALSAAQAAQRPAAQAGTPAGGEKPPAGGPQTFWVSNPVTLVDSGFRYMYQLKFSEARDEFTAWEEQHPNDPLGYSSEAASYLFQEFYKQGILTSEFFLDDKRLLGGIEGTPDRALSDAFHHAVDRAQKAGQDRLARDPRDVQGLLALTMTNGMLADYSSLIERRQLATLHLLGQSEEFAHRLLAVDPSAGDAYVALGVSNYILACLPAYKRFFLRIGGVHGDKAVGMRQLELAVAQGHYLQPYAQLLLALTSLREKRPQRAQALLANLASEFPENPLFRRELVKLGAITAPK
jgi:tetratricopeptide (TPR) repeat protein